MRATQHASDPQTARYLTKIGKDIKRLREMAGLTQEEYAAKAGIPVGTVRDIEQGYDARFSAHAANARYLGLPFGYGFSDDITEQLKAIVNLLHDLGERLGRLEGRQTSEGSPDPCGSLVQWSQNVRDDGPPLPPETLRRDSLYDK